MAYRRRRVTRSRYGRQSTRRRRSTARRRSGSARTIKIVVQTVPASPVALGQKSMQRVRSMF